tara:strand:+ start:318 stop:602 length:285 start_codon:yes stop_codon:yes gene_type:complete
MKEQILALADAYADVTATHQVHAKERAALVAALDALMTERDWLEEQNQKLSRIHAERTVERDELRGELQMARAWLHEADASDKQLRKELAAAKK